MSILSTGGLVLEKRANVWNSPIYTFRMNGGKSISARGLIRRGDAEFPFELQRFAPHPSLRDFVQDYWLTRWDLPVDRPHRQEVLPHPNVNAVVDLGAGSKTGIFGVVTGTFERRLVGKGCAFGIKFWPGAFRGFCRSSLASMTDRQRGFEELFGEAGSAYEIAVKNATTGKVRVDQADRLLLSASPSLDEGARRTRLAVERIASEQILRVDELVERMGSPKRSLQRLFREYIGVSPKWVIQRYRLHEALEKLHEGKPVDFGTLAVRLGYFDQAHFNQDFRAWVGSTPARYERVCRGKNPIDPG